MTQKQLQEICQTRNKQDIALGIAVRRMISTGAFGTGSVTGRSNFELVVRWWATMSGVFKLTKRNVLVEKNAYDRLMVKKNESVTKINPFQNPTVKAVKEDVKNLPSCQRRQLAGGRNTVTAGFSNAVSIASVTRRLPNVNKLHFAIISVTSFSRRERHRQSVGGPVNSRTRQPWRSSPRQCRQ